jgi:hypothetical protein
MNDLTLQIDRRTRQVVTAVVLGDRTTQHGSPAAASPPAASAPSKSSRAASAPTTPAPAGHAPIAVSNLLSVQAAGGGYSLSPAGRLAMRASSPWEPQSSKNDCACSSRPVSRRSVTGSPFGEPTPGFEPGTARLQGEHSGWSEVAHVGLCPVVCAFHGGALGPRGPPSDGLRPPLVAKFVAMQAARPQVQEHRDRALIQTLYIEGARPMSKSKATKYTKIRNSIDYLPETGEGGDTSIDVSVRRYISVDVDGVPEPLELNAWEARKLGRALINAARKLDGTR